MGDLLFALLWLLVILFTGLIVCSAGGSKINVNPMPSYPRPNPAPPPPEPKRYCRQRCKCDCNGGINDRTN